MPLSYLTGCYRLLNFKNFHREIGLGLGIDFFLNAIGMLIVQGLNNSYLNTNAAESGLVFEFSNLQSAAVIGKIIFFFGLIIEFILYFVKLRHLNRYLKQNLITGTESKLSEVERRRIFAKRYAMGNVAWLLNCIFILALILGLAETQKCKDG